MATKGEKEGKNDKENANKEGKKVGKERSVWTIN